MTIRGRRHVACAVLAASALSVALSGCGLLDAANQASESKESQQPSPVSSPSNLKVPLYWIGDAGTSSYLYREYRDYATQDAASSGDVVSTAIAMLTRNHPQDDDYHTLWKPVSSVGSSMSADGTLTIDVSSDMFDPAIKPAQAQMAIQQLVYTATAAAAVGGINDVGPETKVVILVDGKKGYKFGDEVLGRPMSRDKAAVAPLWIIDPGQDTKTKSNISVKMVASNIASKVFWDIKTNNDTVASGEEKLSGQDAGLQEIQFSKSLPKGKYTIRLYVRTEDLRDPSLAIKDQEISVYDDHTFTVED